jgi:hypothetical protein
MLSGDGTGVICIGSTDQPHLKNIKPRFFAANDVSALASHIQALKTRKMQVVVSFARLAKAPQSGRGKATDISAFSVIGMDIDIADPGKPNKALPKSIDEALEALETLPLPPTFVNKSGSGLHAYWGLESELRINDEEDRKQARAFISNFYRGVAVQLPQYSFDATHDLARMFRAPESFNLKDIKNPLEVSVLVNHLATRRYSHDDIISVSVEGGVRKPFQPLVAEASADTAVPIDVQLMQSGCNWFRESLNNGDAASYSEWFAVASLLSRSPNGRALFHQWSSSHPNYDPDETDAKYDQVDLEKADRTCAGLAAIDGGKRCADCVFKGGVNSPLELAVPTKRAVVVNGRQLPEKTASLWAGVHVNNNPPRLFSFENQIARINEGDATVEVLDLVRSKYEFARQVNWLSSVRKGWGAPTNPCPIVIADAMSTPLPPLPVLNGVISIPVLTSTGRVLQEPGYDAETGLFYIGSNFCKPVIQLNASKQDALDARKWIEEEVLVDFPFEDDSSKAAAISLAILPFVRELISGQTPMYLLDKPAAGTGATMLTKALLMPFLGKEISVKPWTSSEEERRKQITAHMMSGGGPFFFDNMSNYINSDVLAMALTADEWSDRVLQTSRMVNLKNRSIWAATGNNPNFHWQIARRIARIRLIPKTSDPTQRTGFKHPELLNWVRENRQTFVEKILTILVAWTNAGQPSFSGKTLASYESWSRVLGGILEFIEMPGFLANLDSFKASQDNEGQATVDLVQLWWDQHQGGPMRAAQFYEAFKDTEVAGLWDAPSEKGRCTKAGRWMQALKDRIFDLNGVQVKVSKNGRDLYLKEVEDKN